MICWVQHLLESQGFFCRLKPTGSWNLYILAVIWVGSLFEQVSVSSGVRGGCCEKVQKECPNYSLSLSHSRLEVLWRMTRSVLFLQAGVSHHSCFIFR